MAKDFFEGFFGKEVLGADFFQTLDDVTKNIQTNVHTICEKWKNGELVSKDEEKYENGKKTLDIHQSTNTDVNGTLLEIDKDEDNGCTGDCGKCHCGKDVVGVNAEDEIKRLRAENKDIQKSNDDLIYYNESLIKENESLSTKLKKIKALFKSEF